MNKYEFHLTIEPAITFYWTAGERCSPDHIGWAVKKIGLKFYHIANYGPDGTELNREYITGLRSTIASDDEAIAYLARLASHLKKEGLNVVRTKLEAPITQETPDVYYYEAHWKVRFQSLTPCEMAAICNIVHKHGFRVSKRLNGDDNTLLFTRRWENMDDATQAFDGRLRTLLSSSGTVLEVEREVCLWDSAEWLDADWMGW